MSFFNKNGGEVTADLIKEKAPEIYQGIFDAGKADAEKASKTALNEAVDNERKRISGILGLIGENPECLKTAIKMIDEGKSVAEAAPVLVKEINESNKKKNKMNNFENGAAEVPPEGQEQELTGNEYNEDPAEVWKKDEELQKLYKNKGGYNAYMKQMEAWIKDKKLQAEYGEDVNAYLASCRRSY